MKKTYSVLGIILVCIVLLVVGSNRLGTRSGVTDAQVNEPLPGDSVFPHPALSIDRAATLPVSATVAWPWVTQLGYQRAGWYAPRWLENVLHLYSADSVLPQYQTLTVGQIIPDFGGGTLQVLAIEPDRYVEYGSIGHGASTTTPRYNFTWTLALENDTPSTTSFHLRLRLPQSEKPGILPSTFAGMIDYATDEVMFAGLTEELRMHS